MTPTTAQSGPPETPKAPMFGRERAHDRAIASIALPALGSLAAAPLVGMVDVLVAGRLGTTEQAALAVGVAMFGFLIFSTNFLEYGTTALVAQYTGGGDEAAARTVLRRSLALSLVVGVALVALTFALAPWVASTLMRAEGGTADGSADYLRLRMLGAIPFLVTRTGHGWFRGRGNTRLPLAITTVSSLAAVVAAPVLALGLETGLRGIAIATAGAELAGAAAFLVVLRRPLTERATAATRTVSWRAMLLLNRDIVLRTVAVTLTFTAAGAVAANASAEGTVAAGHGILASVWIFCALSLDALAIAGQSLIGSAVGAGRPALAHTIAARINTLEAGAGVVIGVALLAAMAPLTGVFTSDPAVRDVLRAAFVLLALSMPVSAVVFGMDGILIGATDARFLRNSMVTAAAPALVALAILGGLGSASLLQIWFVITLFLGLRFVLMARRLREGTWAGPSGAVSER